jgi:hypothetical protein
MARWLLRTFGRSFAWKLGALAAVAVVALVKGFYG